jgi:hypothetical protein
MEHFVQRDARRDAGYEKVIEQVGGLIPEALPVSCGRRDRSFDPFLSDLLGYP